MDILCLPTALILRIAKNLSVKDRTRLQQTCRGLELHFNSKLHIHDMVRWKIGRYSALDWAALKGSLSLAEIAIERRPKTGPASERKYIDSPLQLAARYNYPDIIRFLVKHGAWINVKNKNGRTPLHSAVVEGSFEAFRELLALGADIHYTDFTFDTPVHEAAFRGKIEYLRVLIDSGFDFRMTGMLGRTVLHSAAAGAPSHNPEIIKYLLEHEQVRILINEYDDLDSTALDVAMRNSCPEDTIRLLLQHGAKKGLSLCGGAADTEEGNEN